MSLIIISQEHFETVLLNAFRYAIRGHGQTVQDTCDAIKLHLHKASLRIRHLILSEIEKALEKENFLNDEDRKEWLQVLNYAN